MKNILLLTTIYPAPDLQFGTSAIHYFTKEWVKMGYNVKVIHYQAIYPSLFYLFAKLFRDKIASKTGAIVFTKKDKDIKEYVMDNVSVYRIPIFKRIPHGKYSNRVIKFQIEKISQILTNVDFVPDIIIGHFANPQLKLLFYLKKLYSARTCMVMHNVGDHVGDSIKRLFKNDYKELMDNIDIWGYRSLQIKKGFEKNFGIQKESFLCYSGIPEEYIRYENNRIFKNRIQKFVFVGELIERKYPLSLLNAINKVYSDKNYHITYIGQGAESAKIQAAINTLEIQKNITFLGRIPRNEIISKLDNSDCLIMISKDETFGLVYLEAMARGCITIGSRDQGIDGVIMHGINGFLCEAGNDSELTDLLNYIKDLTPSQLALISQNAILTAKEMTDYYAAKKYILAVDNN